MDQEALRQYALGVWRQKQGEYVSRVIAAGDRLGIFKAMAGAGWVSSDELADRTGLAERPLREWLLCLAAANILEWDDGSFMLDEAGAAVLADEEGSPYFAPGIFALTPPEVIEPIVDLLRTGRGVGFDGAQGEHAILGMERLFGPYFRKVIPQLVLPQLGIGGAVRIADLGCGAGAGAEMLARFYPEAEVVGIDSSHASIVRAKERATSRISFVEADAMSVNEHGPFGLVTAFDVFHDLPRPDLAAEAVRESLGERGVLLIKEARAASEFLRNRKNPILALRYGVSLVSCLQAGLSTEDGWGLGNVGLHQEALIKILIDAGFSDVQRMRVEDPAFAYYVAHV